MKEEFDVLIEMLAEIKQQNSEMMKHLSNHQDRPNSESEKISEVQEAITAFAHVYGNHLKEHSSWERELKDATIKLGQRLRDIREGQANIITQQTETLNAVSKREIEAQVPPVIKKFYLLDAKKWIQWAIWGVMILITSASIGWATSQIQRICTLHDYALRYRILRMEHSVSNDAFAKLDSIFDTHRSESEIAALQQRVITYEDAIQCQAELLHRQQQLSAEQTQLQH